MYTELTILYKRTTKLRNQHGKSLCISLLVKVYQLLFVPFYWFDVSINSLRDGGNGVDPGNLQQIYNYDASPLAAQRTDKEERRCFLDVDIFFWNTFYFWSVKSLRLVTLFLDIKRCPQI